MASYSTYTRLFTAIGLSLLFLVPYLGRTLHRYHAAEHVRVHHCNDAQQERQHLHDPDVLDWHHCQFCTLPVPVEQPVVTLLASATLPGTVQLPVSFSTDLPFLWPHRQLTVRGPPAIS